MPTTTTSRATGRVLEMLSENQCQGWLEGYLLTGRHGFFSCYEAFIHIVDSMFNQHAKWLKVCARIPWRRPIASLNYLLTSHVWRQDHNGFSHQDPGFIDHVVNKKAQIIRVYLPPDANCLLHVTDAVPAQPEQGERDRRRQAAAAAVARRWSRPSPTARWASSIWRWASSDHGGECDVVLACCGDVPTLETLAAADLLRKLAARPARARDQRGGPDAAAAAARASARPAKTRSSMRCSRGTSRSSSRFTATRGSFTASRTSAHNHDNLHVRGYKEEGTTTTPFDMTVLNGLDRFHLVMDVIERVPRLRAARRGHHPGMREKLIEHRHYVTTYGDDMPEIKNWKWGARGAAAVTRSALTASRSRAHP